MNEVLKLVERLKADLDGMDAWSYPENDYGSGQHDERVSSLEEFITDLEEIIILDNCNKNKAEDG